MLKQGKCVEAGRVLKQGWDQGLASKRASCWNHVSFETGRPHTSLWRCRCVS